MIPPKIIYINDVVIEYVLKEIGEFHVIEQKIESIVFSWCIYIPDSDYYV